MATNFQKISFYVLLVFTLVTGYVLTDILLTKAGFIDAQGRVVSWDDDYVTLKFAAEGRDSLMVRTKLSYTKNKNRINQYKVVPIKYNPAKPERLEIEGITGDPFFSGGLVFVFFLIGFVATIINIQRRG